MQQHVTLTRQAIRTPRAAAVAGIIHHLWQKKKSKHNSLEQIPSGTFIILTRIDVSKTFHM